MSHGVKPALLTLFCHTVTIQRHPQFTQEVWWPAVQIRRQFKTIYGSLARPKSCSVRQELLSSPLNSLFSLWPTDTPDAPRKLAGSTHSLASGTTGPSQGGVQPLSQRKRLLRAPTLAELDSSESDVRCRLHSWDVVTSIFDALREKIYIVYLHNKGHVSI